MLFGNDKIHLKKKNEKKEDRTALEMNLNV